MKRLLFCALCATTLAACDNVDITKYPENIQKCYNDIIYNDSTCTKSKKVILNYCQCTEAAVENITNETNAAIQQANAIGFGFIVALGAGNVQSAFVQKTEAAYDACAEKTGYTRAKNCKSDKK